MEVIEGKEFHVMTEETANELAKALRESKANIQGISEEVRKVTPIILNKIKSDIEEYVEHYTQKAETSCFITRWWYKLKLQQAKCGLEAINDIIKKYYANRRSDKSPA